MKFVVHGVLDIFLSFAELGLRVHVRVSDDEAALLPL